MGATKQKQIEIVINRLNKDGLSVMAATIESLVVDYEKVCFERDSLKKLTRK